MFGLSPKDSGKFKWAKGEGDRGSRVFQAVRTACAKALWEAFGSIWEGAWCT